MNSNMWCKHWFWIQPDCYLKMQLNVRIMLGNYLKTTFRDTICLDDIDSETLSGPFCER